MKLIAHSVLLLVEPVSESYDEEEENEGSLLVTMATASAVKTGTADAVRYGAATTASPRARHRDPAVVEIDLLDAGVFLMEVFLWTSDSTHRDGGINHTHFLIFIVFSRNKLSRVRIPAAALPSTTLGQLFTHTCAYVAKQYNLVSANGR